MPALALAICVALLAVGETFTLLTAGDVPRDETLGNLGFAPPVLAFAVVGALIATRRPGNRIGWICLVIGSLFAVVVAGDAIAAWAALTDSLSPGVRDWLAWLTAAWVPALGLLAIELPLRLPDGRPLWRRYARVCSIVVAVVSVVMFCQPLNIPEFPELHNPTEVGWLDPFSALFVLFPLLALGAVASVFMRYRRSAAIERLQLRWIALGGIVFVGMLLVSVATSLAGVDDGNPVGIVLVILAQAGYAAIPVAIAFAVLRHRLYDIDVVINRALVYAGLTLALGAAYLAAVLLFGLVLAPLTNDSGLAVAASTLAVAALFRPARTRIQPAVDRRFFRRKYDAARTLSTFSASLRDELDLEALSVELRAIVEQTMQPAHITLWLRKRAA